jgi:hypothetical protein
MAESIPFQFNFTFDAVPPEDEVTDPEDTQAAVPVPKAWEPGNVETYLERRCAVEVLTDDPKVGSHALVPLTLAFDTADTIFPCLGCLLRLWFVKERLIECSSATLAWTKYRSQMTLSSER